MSTYDHKQVIADYANGKITPDMAIGHSLQHIDLLYEARTATNTDYRELRHKVKHLEDALQTLRTQVDRWQKRPPERDRLQTLENGLTALNLTVYQLKADVDSLIAHTGMPPRLTGAKQPPPAN
jgi:hypothetical protein